ncbi:MAG: Ig-like domain-containing protein [Candidatus Aenigmatarchaeota archaeon]
MRKVCLFFLFFLSFFAQVSRAAPIFDPALTIPQNGSYIYGKDTDTFSTVIEGTLDTSTAKLHARTEDPTSIWKNISMTCFQISESRWNCTGYVIGLEALVKDGDGLLYYFDAYDLEGSYRSLGNSSSPLKVIIDRSPPEINFTMPKDQFYYSGEVEIKIKASDKYSGVDPSSVKYSFDNSTWLDMVEEDGVFTSLEKWNTRIYSNNQSVYIYGKAGDRFGNTAYTRISVFVDNEPPSLSVNEPKENQIIYGVYVLSAKASDKYSGLDIISYEVGNFIDQFYCSGNQYDQECTASFDSALINDGKYMTIVKVYDRAGNEVNASVPITVDNLPPKITIFSPAQTSTVSGNFNVSADVRDDGVGVSKVRFRIESSGSAGEWKDMWCESNFCSAIWNSSEVVDGNYFIRIYAEDLLRRNSSLTSYISVVNTVNIPQTTTTTTIVGEKNQPNSISVEDGIKKFGVISNIINKIKTNPILGIAFLLPLFSLPVIFLLFTRKPEKKEDINIEEKFEDCFTRLEEIRNFIINSQTIPDLNQIKDRIRIILISLEKMEKDPLNKTVELVGSKRKKIGEELKSLLEKRGEETKIIQTQKEEYLQEIFKLLNDCLTEESLENVKRNLEVLNILIRKLKGLIEREINILNEALGEIGYLSKS